MVCLSLLVGHLWTCSGCFWPPRSGSVYIEVSVSMTAVHTLHADVDIVTAVRQILTSYYRAIWGHSVSYNCLIRVDSCYYYFLFLSDGEFFNYINVLLVSFSWTICRGSWMCKLWCHLHSSVAKGRYRALPVQRLWTVPQDERTEPAAYQAQT